MPFLDLSDVAITVLALAFAGALGLMLGKVQVAGVGLGIGGVLFAGLAVGHLAAARGLAFDAPVLHFVREFGLILFVYTIGIQVGPGFFKSFGRDGLRLNLVAMAIVGLGVAATLAVGGAFGVELPVLVGIMSGAVTNTPGLGAATQALADAGFDRAAQAGAGLGYAVAYPFGIVGILLAMLLVRALFRVDLAAEAAAWARARGEGEAVLPAIDVVVTNPALVGRRLDAVPGLYDGEVVASRLKQGGELRVPTRDARLGLGDSLHLVGPAAELRGLRDLLGRDAEAPLTTRGTRLTWARLVVTETRALGVRLADLALPEGHDVTISRINRAGIELPPRADSRLAFGDIVTVVGLPGDIETVKLMLGNQRARLDQVQFEALLLGLALGVVLGSIPLALPGLPAPVKLGLAGGPLLAAILLGRLGHLGPLVWFMPPVANTALREFGIVLFLSVVGISAGDRFLATILDGPGLAWIGYGALITFVPLALAGVLARGLARLNYLSLAGVLAGAMTDPPALAFAAAMNPSAAASVAYVAVYPLVMVLRILAPQVMVLALAGAG